MRTETTWSFLAGFVVGGVTVALLDPRRGAARRALLRDKSRAVAKDAARGVVLRHDHGSQYTARDFQAGLSFVGIQSSPSYVRALDRVV